MDEKIKSALDIAMERAEHLGELTTEEANQMKWVPEGEKIAAFYLRGEADLHKALEPIEKSVFSYLLSGLVRVLLANLGLLRNSRDKKTNSLVFDALKILSGDKQALGVLLSQVTNIQGQYSGYGQQELGKRYQEVKSQFSAQIQQVLEQRGAKGPLPNVEAMPEFQAQWRATVSQFERQYDEHLMGLREQIRELVLNKPASPSP